MLAHGTITMLPTALGPLPLLFTLFGKLLLLPFVQLTLPPGSKRLPEAQESAHLHLVLPVLPAILPCLFDQWISANST